MNVPKELEQYVLSWGFDDEKHIRSEISKTPIKELLKKQLHYLDCTRIGKVSGLRLMQTIGFPYSHEMTITLHLIEKLNEDEQEEYLNMVIKRHKDNLAYEEQYPPVWYSKKKWTRPKESKTEKVVKPKVDKKTRKVKSKVLDIPFLTSKFKIQL